MKKRLLNLLLVVLPWAACFLVAFFSGWLEDGTNEASTYGLVTAVICTLAGPFLVSLYLTAKLVKGALRRILTFCVLTVVAYSGILILPAPARVSLWGQACRLRHGFPTGELRSAAEEIKRKWYKKTLRTTTAPNDLSTMEGDTFVDESELPSNLRGRIKFVRVDYQFVQFQLNERVAILYFSNGPSDSKYLFSLSNGLYLSMR